MSQNASKPPGPAALPVPPVAVDFAHADQAVA